VPWTQLTIALLVFAGTSLQSWLAMYELYGTNGAVLDDWDAESELIKEQPRLKRRAAARTLRQMRPWETHEAIETMRVSVLSWALLSLASLIAVVASIVQLAS